MRLLGLGLAAVVGVVVGNACVLDLEHEIACGDGWVDEEAGEECDPAVRESYAGKCLTVDGTHDAVCHPTACVLLLSEADCALCGNGRMDEGEECDPNIQHAPDEVGTAVGCSFLDAPFEDYTSGETSKCLSDCTWSRRACGFCGNDKLDRAEPVWMSPVEEGYATVMESCDGDRFNSNILEEESSVGCLLQDAVSNLACSSNCQDLVPRAGPLCCLPSGSPCPTAGGSLQCCHEFAHPEESEHCYPILVPDGVTPEPGTSPGGTCK